MTSRLRTLVRYLRQHRVSRWMVYSLVMGLVSGLGASLFLVALEWLTYFVLDYLAGFPLGAPAGQNLVQNMPHGTPMYRDALPLAEARTRIYFKHGGAFFPETMAFWGTYLNENYGYDRTGKSANRSDVIASVRGETERGPWKPGEVSNTYIRRYWQGTIELLAMMLDYHALTQDERFLGETLLPLARPILTFYREHYPQRDEQGKIVFAPAQSLETWHVAVNPMPEIAGLRWVTDGLLRLPNLSEDDRKAWIELHELLPPLPSRVEFQTKKKYLIPALQYDVQANSENPELYAVFPYRLFGVGKADIETGRETYARRLYKATGCWRQDPRPPPRNPRRMSTSRSARPRIRLR